MTTKLPKMRVSQVWSARSAEDPPFHIGDLARVQAVGQAASDHDLRDGKRYVGFTFREAPGPELSPGTLASAAAAALREAFPGDEIEVSLAGQTFTYA